MNFLAGIASSILQSSIVQPIVSAVLGWQKQKLDAVGSHEAREQAIAIRTVELDQREAELNAATVQVETREGGWLTRSVRPAIGWAVVVLLWKLLVFDKALGQWTNGSTDPLSPEIWSVVQTVIYAYFGARAAEKIANTVAGVLRK